MTVFANKLTTTSSSPEFTKYQQHAIGFKDLGITLWEVHKYANGMLIFNEVKSPLSKEPIAAIAKNSTVARKLAREIKVYTEDDHLKSGNEIVKELYSELKSVILSLDKNIEIRPRKRYIAFHQKENFVSFFILKSKLKTILNIRINEINDPSKKARNVPSFGGRLTFVEVQDRNEIPYTISLIKQAYEKTSL